MSINYKTNSLILNAFVIEKKYFHVPTHILLTRVNAGLCGFKSFFSPLLLASVHYCSI